MKAYCFLSGLLLFLGISSCKDEPILPTPEIPFEWSEFEWLTLDYVPLSRRVTVNTNLISKITIKVLGRNGRASDIQHDFNELGTVHTFDVHGLYADSTNTVIVQFFNAANNLLGDDTLSIETGPLIEGVPDVAIEVSTNPNTEDGTFFLVSYRGRTKPMLPLMIDQFGDIRWIADFSTHPELSELHFDVGLERLENGNWYFGDKSTDQIYEMNMAGELVNTWLLPGYEFHHNVQEASNGNFLVTVSKDGNTHSNGNLTVEDVLLEIDRGNNIALNEWNLLESLDENRVVLVNNLNQPTIDWIHVNSIEEGLDGQGVLISGRTQGVVQLDADNQVDWILANHKGWGNNRAGEDLNQFLLQPLDAAGQPIIDQAIMEGFEKHPDFDWPWYQHASTFLPNSDLLLFDNGINRQYEFPPYYSRAVVYRIDTAAMTVQQIWEYGSDRPELYSNIVSDVDYLEDEQAILMCSGRIQGGPSGFLEGRIVKIDYATKTVLFEARIIGNSESSIIFHRAEQLPLYPD
ncbi:MAG: aryl-sulfate sulfotransferase [Bacteroidota bacterium]